MITNFSNVTRLAVQVGDRLYFFFCEVDSPTIDAKTALSHFTKQVEEVETAQREKKAADCTESCAKEE